MAVEEPIIVQRLHAYLKAITQVIKAYTINKAAIKGNHAFTIQQFFLFCH